MIEWETGRGISQKSGFEFAKADEFKRQEL